MEPSLIDDAMFRVFSDLPENKQISLPRSLATYYRDRMEKIYKECILSKPITVDELKTFVRKHRPETFALMVMFNYNRAGEHVEAKNRYDIFFFQNLYPEFNDPLDWYSPPVESWEQITKDIWGHLRFSIPA